MNSSNTNWTNRNTITETLKGLAVVFGPVFLITFCFSMKVVTTNNVERTPALASNLETHKNC